MDFVSKKDFEAAVAVIEKALKNDQVHDGYRKEPVKDFRFSFDNSGDFSINFKQVMFIAPDLAVKTKLHSLRNELKAARERSDINQKELEKLEKEEKSLVAFLDKDKE